MGRHMRQNTFLQLRPITKAIGGIGNKNWGYGTEDNDYQVMISDVYISKGAYIFFDEFQVFCLEQRSRMPREEVLWRFLVAKGDTPKEKLAKYTAQGFRLVQKIAGYPVYAKSEDLDGELGEKNSIILIP